MPAAEGGLLAASFQMDLFVGCTVIAGASMDEDGAQGLLAMLPQASHEAITMATWWFLPMGSHGGRWLLAIGGSETGEAIVEARGLRGRYQSAMGFARACALISDVSRCRVDELMAVGDDGRLFFVGGP